MRYIFVVAFLIIIPISNPAQTLISTDIPEMGRAKYYSESPDGNWLVYQEESNIGKRIVSYNFESRRKTYLTELLPDYASTSYEISPNSDYILFKSDIAENNDFDLFITRIDQNSVINLTPSGEVNDYSFSEDGLRILFTSDVNGQYELYSRSVTGGPVTKISDTYTNTYNSIGYVFNFWTVPASESVVYIQRLEGYNTLFISPVTENEPMDLAGSIVDGGSVSSSETGFSISETHVIFEGDLETSGIDEFFLVNLMSQERINLSSLVSGSVKRATFSDDGQSVLILMSSTGFYSCDLNGENLVEITSEDVTSFDSFNEKIIYLNNADEILLTNIQGAEPVRVSRSLGENQIVGSELEFRFNDNGNWVIYSYFDLETFRQDLYGTHLESLTDQHFTDGEGIDGILNYRYWKMSPDESTVVFLNYLNGGVWDLYGREVGGTNQTFKVNHDLSETGQTFEFSFLSGGNNLVYRARDDEEVESELFLVSLAPFAINMPLSYKIPENEDIFIELYTENNAGPVNVNWEINSDFTEEFLLSESNSLSASFIPNFEVPKDADKDNVYEITLNANHENGNKSITLNIEIIDVNDPPIFSNLENTFTVTEGDIEPIVQIQISDEDDAPNDLLLSIVGSDKDQFAIQNNFLYFNGVSSFSSPTDSDLNNLYEISIVVSDGTESSTFDMNITVVKSDPEITLGTDLESNDIILFPTIVDSWLNLNIPDRFNNHDVLIVNMDGKLVLKNSSENSKLNVSRLNKGIYMVLIDNRIGGRFIKK